MADLYLLIWFIVYYAIFITLASFSIFETTAAEDLQRGGD